MSRRIEIELTSKRDDGTWTWRAAGALQPKGVVDGAVVPAGVSVSDVVRAEVESDLDGTRVLSITAPKQKAARTGLLEILPSSKPFEPVTQQLRKKGVKDGDKRRRGPRKDGEDRPPRREGGDKPRRPFFEAPPEVPMRPKPKRIKPRRINVDAVLAELPEAHRTIAEKVLDGGVPAVRAAIESQNKDAVAQGREKVPAEGLIQIAEQLLPRLRVAEWRDRAAAAESIIEEVDLRDLRSLVVSADQLVAIDEETRAQVAKMKQALVARQETEVKLWLDDIKVATDVGRVVRALRLSSQPPKAGVPFPPALATQLVDATVAGLTPDAPAERWIALLEAAAFSPVHGKVLPPQVPAVVADDLLKTVTRLAPLMPQLAALFGVMVDPKARAPRPLPAARSARPQKKTSAQLNAKDQARTSSRPPKPAAAKSAPAGAAAGDVGSAEEVASVDHVGSVAAVAPETLVEAAPTVEQVPVGSSEETVEVTDSAE